MTKNVKKNKETKGKSKEEEKKEEEETTRGVGQPLLFKSVKALERKIKLYFDSCWRPKQQERVEKDSKTGKNVIIMDDILTNKGEKVLEQFKPYTITGLAVFLKTSRQTLINYENRDKYFDTIKGAKTLIENYVEECLFKSNVAGPIFNLKNNFADWKDKQEIEDSSANKQIEELRGELKGLFKEDKK